MASSATSDNTSAYVNNTGVVGSGTANSHGGGNNLQQNRSARSPMNNCVTKYEGTATATASGVPPGGSPQDLRTSSETEGTPQPKSPSSPAAVSQPPLSPLLSSTTQVTSA